MDQRQEESKTPGGDTQIPFWRVVLSVLQASFGVQSSDNRERDFSQGKLIPFVVAALLFTGAFVLGLMLIVQAVIGE